MLSNEQKEALFRTRDRLRSKQNLNNEERNKSDDGKIQRTQSMPKMLGDRQI